MWYNEAGENSDIILSSNVSYERNITGFEFPNKLSDESKESILKRAEEFASKTGLRFIKAEDLSNEQRLEFLKNKIVDLDFAKNPEGKGILINSDESMSIIVNQENHFKIQSFTNGSKVEELFAKTSDLAVEVEKNFDVAFSERLGFLTARAGMVGTGLKISFIVSIPAIERGGVLGKLLGRLSSIEWKLIPYVGDASSKKTGNLYVITNTSTLGVTEEKLYERALTVVKDVVKVERMCRDAIYSKNKIVVEDQYFRAYGLLKYCRKIDLTEALDALGWLRFVYSLVDSEDLDIDLMKINKMTDRICTEIKNTKGGSSSIKLGEARAKQIRAILEGDDN